MQLTMQQWADEFHHTPEDEMQKITDIVTAMGSSQKDITDKFLAGDSGGGRAPLPSHGHGLHSGMQLATGQPPVVIKG